VEDAAAPTVHAAAPAADAAAIVDGIIPQHPDSSCGEGRSRRKRKSVDYVSARVSTDLSDEMERPQWLKKTCVLPDAKPTSQAGPEATSEQARSSSPLAPDSSEQLWISPQRQAPAEVTAAPAGDAAATVNGAEHPDSGSSGEGRSGRKRKAVDYVSARVSTDISDEMERPQWLKKGTKQPSPEAVTAPDAAPEVDDCYWAAVEVVPDELAQDHPSVLVGSEVCVMAAAYPTDVFTRRSAIGWRGLVTHERGGASDPQVRIFGFWFRLADETFLKPVKQLTQGSRVE
jgi:hypothetical protein